jgi:predicted RNA-binding Zn-ribbon protein involved in translation (DUF1610 family)
MEDRAQDEWNSYFDLDISDFITSCPHCGEQVKVTVEFVRKFTATMACS